MRCTHRLAVTCHMVRCRRQLHPDKCRQQGRRLQVAAGAVQRAVVAGAEALLWSEVHNLEHVCQRLAGADASVGVHCDEPAARQVRCSIQAQPGCEADDPPRCHEVHTHAVHCIAGDGEQAH
jgi:hypothetical protein